jgi:transcriptional regulator with XRE-family HTH domain
MTPEESFGQVLREARRERGVSQEQLAFDSGYHRNFIGLLERGLRSPSLSTIFRLAAVLGMTPVELISRTQAAGPTLRPRRGVE